MPNKFNNLIYRSISDSWESITTELDSIDDEMKNEITLIKKILLLVI